MGQPITQAAKNAVMKKYPGDSICFIGITVIPQGWAVVFERSYPQAKGVKIEYRVAIYDRHHGIIREIMA